MKTAFIILFMYFNCLVAQTEWMRFVPGWNARKSMIIQDTIFTFGTGDYNGNNNFVYVNKSHLNGNIIASDTLDYYYLNPDPYSQSEYRSKNTVIYENGKFEMALLVIEKAKSKYRGATYFFNYPNYSKDSINLNHDTATTFITQFSKINTNKYAIVTPNIVYDRLNAIENWYLFNLTNKNPKIIKQQLNPQICPSCHSISFEALIGDKLNNENLFLNIIDKWDYHGIPAQFQSDIIKMDTSGNTIWTCRVNRNDSFNTSHFQFVQKPNGNLLCVWNNYYYAPYKGPRNYHYEDFNDSNTLWFAEIDYNTGKILWTKNMRTFLRSKIKQGDFITSQDILIKDMQLINNQYIILVGDKTVAYNTLPYVKRKAVILKIDLNANPIWYREHEIYPNDSGDRGMTVYSFLKTPDNGYLLTGEYMNINGQASNGEFWQKAILLKLDSFGCYQSGCQSTDDTKIISIENKLCKVFPNPISDIININLPINSNDYWQIEIFDNLGKNVLTKKINENVFKIETKQYPNGIYIIQIFNPKNNHYETHKISISR